jgi:hypothetical protein
MDLTPRPFGDILNQGMNLFARVWRRLFAPAFGAFVALGGLTILIFELTDVTEFLQQLITDPTSIESMSETELLDSLIRLGGTAAIAGVLQLVATGFVNLATHRIVGDEIGGTQTTPGVAAAWALRRMPVLLVAGFCAVVAIAFGLLAFVVPGIWLIGVLTMLTPVIALEDVGPLQAIRRCFTLVRGRWFPTMGFYLLVALLGSVAAQLVQILALPVLAIGGVGLGAGLGFVFLLVVQGLVVAAIAVMTTRWYFDLRARQEPLSASNLP